MALVEGESRKNSPYFNGAERTKLPTPAATLDEIAQATVKQAGLPVEVYFGEKSVAQQPGRLSRLAETVASLFPPKQVRRMGARA